MRKKRPTDEPACPVAEHAKVLGQLQADIANVNKTAEDTKRVVSNGLAKEMRDAVAVLNTKIEQKVEVVRNLVIGILVTILVGVVLFFLQNKFDANKNRELIMALDKTLNVHIAATTKAAGGEPMLEAPK